MSVIELYILFFIPSFFLTVTLLSISQLPLIKAMKISQENKSFLYGINNASSLLFSIVICFIISQICDTYHTVTINRILYLIQVIACVGLCYVWLMCLEEPKKNS